MGGSLETENSRNWPDDIGGAMDAAANALGESGMKEPQERLYPVKIGYDRVVFIQRVLMAENAALRSVAPQFGQEISVDDTLLGLMGKFKNASFQTSTKDTGPRVVSFSDTEVRRLGDIATSSQGRLPKDKMYELIEYTVDIQKDINKMKRKERKKKNVGRIQEVVSRGRAAIRHSGLPKFW